MLSITEARNPEEGISASSVARIVSILLCSISSRFVLVRFIFKPPFRSFRQFDCWWNAGAPSLRSPRRPKGGKQTRLRGVGSVVATAPARGKDGLSWSPRAGPWWLPPGSSPSHESRTELPVRGSAAAGRARRGGPLRGLTFVTECCAEQRG